MITYIPYYRKDRGNIVIRVIVDGIISKVVNTGIKVTSKQWDEKKRLVKNHPNKNIFNQKIRNEIHKLQGDVIKAEIIQPRLTRERVKKIVEGTVVTTDFYKHCQSWIKDKYSNKGTRASALSDLEKVHLYAPFLQFGDIDKRWLVKYENYLRDTLKHEGNTVWKCVKFVRTMLYDAQDVLGKHVSNPFERGEYKMPPYKEPGKDGLTIAEIDSLEGLLKKDIPVLHKIVTAKFLFMCYTGLRISDAKRFTDEHLKDGRIVITSQKTKITTRLKVHNRLAEVLTLLKELPDKKFADQNFNEWLKIIADMAEITRIKLTTHIGRHTFGCLLAEMGVSEEEGMELLGVKDKQVMRTYYRLRQPQIDRAAEKLNNI